MIKFLLRAGRFSQRLLYASILIGIAKNLDELLALVRHPQYVIVPENLSGPEMQRLVERLRSSGGAGPLKPWPSSGVSRSATAPSGTTTAPTGATGRSGPTSGVTGAGSASRGHLSSLPDSTKTVSPTPATKPEGGNHGPAPASSASGPSCQCRDSNKEGPIRPPGKDEYDASGLHYSYCPLYGRQRLEPGPAKHDCGYVHDTQVSTCNAAFACHANGHKSLDFGGGCQCGRNQEFVRFHAGAGK